jgi:histidinol phosphatase-like PHP family hydrolase
LFDHHIHSTRSDGTVTLEGRARSVAVRPHGISDHYPWREKMRDDDDVLRYLDEAAALGLRVGLEYDLGVAPPLLPTTRASLHYLIGAVHQIEIAGVRIGYDIAGQYVKGKLGPGEFPERERFADPELRSRILARTLEVVREGTLEVGIDILGHPTFTPLQALGEPDEAYPLEWQERLIELCVVSEVAIEVNEAYGVPHRSFLELAKRRGARFSVGSDTHTELRPLDRTARMIAEADLPHERFLGGERVRVRAR